MCKLNLEGSYKYKDLIIKDGVIIDNPFSYSISSSQASMWVIAHEDKVKPAISKYLKTYNIAGDVEDCYNYVIHYFIEKNSREYIFNYFGDEFNGYDISMYCMSNIQFAVLGYKHSITKVRGKDTISLVTGEEYEDNQGGGAIETKLSSDSVSQFSGYVRDSLPDESLVKRSLSKDFINEIKYFIYYFETNGFKAFDVLKFLDLFFFNIDELKLTSDKKKSHIENVSKELGESELLIKSLFDLFQKGRKGEDYIMEEIFRIVKDYIIMGLTSLEYGYSGKELNWKNLNDLSYYSFRN